VVGRHAFGVIRVTFKRANAKIPIIHIPSLGHRPPKSHSTLSSVFQVIPEGGSNRDSSSQLPTHTPTQEFGNA